MWLSAGGAGVCLSAGGRGGGEPPRMMGILTCWTPDSPSLSSSLYVCVCVHMCVYVYIHVYMYVYNRNDFLYEMELFVELLYCETLMGRFWIF